MKKASKLFIAIGLIFSTLFTAVPTPLNLMAKEMPKTGGVLTVRGRTDFSKLYEEGDGYSKNDLKYTEKEGGEIVKDPKISDRDRESDTITIPDNNDNNTNNNEGGYSVRTRDSEEDNLDYGDRHEDRENILHTDAKGENNDHSDNKNDLMDLVNRPGNIITLEDAIKWDYEEMFTEEDTRDWTQEMIDEYIRKVKIQIAKIIDVTVPLTSDLAVYEETKKVIAPKVKIINNGTSLVNFNLMEIKLKNINDTEMNLTTYNIEKWTEDSPILNGMKYMNTSIDLGKVLDKSETGIYLGGLFDLLESNTEVKVRVTFKVHPVIEGI